MYVEIHIFIYIYIYTHWNVVCCTNGYWIHSDVVFILLYVLFLFCHSSLLGTINTSWNMSSDVESVNSELKPSREKYDHQSDLWRNEQILVVCVFVFVFVMRLFLFSMSPYQRCRTIQCGLLAMRRLDRSAPLDTSLASIRQNQNDIHKLQGIFGSV